MICNIFVLGAGNTSTTWGTYVKIGAIVGLAVWFAKFMYGRMFSNTNYKCERKDLDAFVIERQIIVPAFQTSDVIPKLIECLKNSGFRLAVLRKKEALQKIVEMLATNGQLNLSNKVEKIMTSGGALFTPLGKDMKEDWGNVIVVNPEKSATDDMKNAFILADTGRCKVL